MTPNDPRGLSREPAQQKTDLEVFLRVRAPELLRQHWVNLLLGVFIVIAVIVFFISRSQNKAAANAALADRTADAYDYARQARAALLESPISSPEANRTRQQSAQQALDAVEIVLANDATPAQKAIALIAKADVYWALSNVKPERLATSQPVIGFDATKKASAYLADAEAAYGEVLGKYADQKAAVGNALMGMGAIAENRSDWKNAETWYRRAADDQSIAVEFRDIAKARLEMLAEVRLPFALAAPASQPTATPAAPPTPAFGPSFGAPAGMILPTTPTPTTSPASIYAPGFGGSGNVGLSVPSLLSTPTTQPTP